MQSLSEDHNENERIVKMIEGIEWISDQKLKAWHWLIQKMTENWNKKMT
jgi:hypothetical protein